VLPGLGSVRPGRGPPHQGVARRGGPWRGAGWQFPEMAGLGHPQSGIARAPAQPGPLFLGLQRIAGARAETQQDRFDDRGVIEQGVRDGARFDPRRDDDRWHSHAVVAEHLGFIVRGLRWRDVIVEAAVFVVDDNQ
jgi:hypothetical protein